MLIIFAKASIPKGEGGGGEVLWKPDCFILSFLLLLFIEDDKRTSKFTVRAAAQMNNGNLNVPVSSAGENKDVEAKQ